MSLTLLKLLLARFWRFFFSTYLLISLIWIFSICVRVFIRQEVYSINVLVLFTLRSLPSILPYITCIAAMLTILNLDKTKELQLTTLMGVSRKKRFVHFSPLFLLLPLFSFYFEGFLIPDLRNTLRNPENFINQGLISKLEKGFQVSTGGWLLGSHQKGSFLIAQDHPEHSTLLICEDLEVDKHKNLIAKHGFLWSNSKKQNDVIQFEQTKLPLERDQDYSAKELNFFELDFSDKDQRHQAGIIVRNTFAPIFLIYLGLALGYYGMTINRGMSFLICLASMLLMYLPLHILGRSLKTETLLADLGILILPYLGCLILGIILNTKAEQHGAC